MKHRPSTTSLAAAGVLLASAFSLGACETFDQFITPGTKVEIRGERVSVLPTARSIDADPKLAAEAVKLPRPSMNSEWPQPGGFSDNVMHHLSAAGDVLRQL